MARNRHEVDVSWHALNPSAADEEARHHYGYETLVYDNLADAATFFFKNSKPLTGYTIFESVNFTLRMPVAPAPAVFVLSEGAN